MMQQIPSLSPCLRRTEAGKRVLFHLRSANTPGCSTAGQLRFLQSSTFKKKFFKNLSLSLSFILEQQSFDYLEKL